MQNLTEHEMTIAVDAAARKAYAVSGAPGHIPFDDLHPMTKNDFRSAVITVVVAALEALPDRSDALRTKVQLEVDAAEAYYGVDANLDAVYHAVEVDRLRELLKV